MPDRDWPRLQRRLARLLRGVAYAFAAAAGAGVLIWQPDAVTEEVGHAGMVGLGVLAVASGVAGAVAVIWHLWRIEWAATWFAAAAFGGYTVIDWGLVATGHASRSAESAALTVAVALLLARGVDLWVFSLDATQARRARVRSWRRVAGLER